jgi:hypothetical protein
MGHSALGTSSTLGETRRGLRVSPTSMGNRTSCVTSAGAYLVSFGMRKRSERLGLGCTWIIALMGGVGGIMYLAQLEFPPFGRARAPVVHRSHPGRRQSARGPHLNDPSLPHASRVGIRGLHLRASRCGGVHLLAGVSVLHAGPALFDLSFVLVSYFFWHRAPGHLGDSASISRVEADHEPLTALRS